MKSNTIIRDRRNNSINTLRKIMKRVNLKELRYMEAPFDEKSEAKLPVQSRTSKQITPKTFLSLWTS